MVTVGLEQAGTSGRLLSGQTTADAIADIAAHNHMTPQGKSGRVSERTLYRWLAAYRQREIADLEPASRRRTTSSVVLSQFLLKFVREQKEIDISASLPEILRRARLEGVLGEHEEVDRSTPPSLELWGASNVRSTGRE